MNSQDIADLGLELSTSLDNLQDPIRQIASAITPIGSSSMPGCDASGGSVGSLTEAVMGITAGLFAIAEAINRIADAREIRE